MHYPAADRNAEVIAEVLKDVLPKTGGVLEIASGTGQHITRFAQRFEALWWQPSDPSPPARASIDAYRDEAKLNNLRPAIDLDVTADWPPVKATCIYCANMIHISPWAATEGLMRGASTLHRDGQGKMTYGPYNVDGKFT